MTSTKKNTKKSAPSAAEVESADEELEAKFAYIAEMMQLAESLLAELKTGESVEKVEDADHAIEEAREFARQILALKPE